MICQIVITNIGKRLRLWTDVGQWPSVTSTDVKERKRLKIPSHSRDSFFDTDWLCQLKSLKVSSKLSEFRSRPFVFNALCLMIKIDEIIRPLFSTIEHCIGGIETSSIQQIIGLKALLKYFFFEKFHFRVQIFLQKLNFRLQLKRFFYPIPASLVFQFSCRLSFPSMIIR